MTPTPRRARARKSPTDYGAPYKFKTFRPGQLDIIQRGINSPKRFVMQAVPTGGGKSLNAIVQALATDSRAAYLTSTKGLQNQLLKDFESIGLIDVRGQSNYRCIDHEGVGEITVDEAPCHFGYNCPRVERTSRGKRKLIPDGVDPCLYFDAVNRATDSPLVVTNYAYWLSAHRYGEGLGDFDLLILDEAHSILDELSSFLSVELTAWEIEGLLASHILPTTSIKEWHLWAAIRLQEVDRELEAIKADFKQRGHTAYAANKKRAKQLRKVKSKLSAISEASGEWVCEHVTKTVRFDIIWPRTYSEKVLFRGIPKILLTSATVRPKTADLIGIPATDLDFQEYPHSFPAENRPTYCVETVRLSARSTDADLEHSVRRIDQIINPRTDRKAIVHTTSYARRNLVLQKSEHRAMMMTHDSKNAREMVEKFKQSTEPVILVSPSVTTGYDFPYSECEYQILMKTPFPDMRSAVMKARKKADPDYDAYIAMQQVVQAAGRGIRAIDDRCEIFIIDDHFGDWFVWRNKHLAPGWFVATVDKRQTIPRAPASMLASAPTRPIVRRPSVHKRKRSSTKQP